MSSCWITCYDDLLWPDAQLVECLCNDPAVNLETITERDRKGILRSKPVIDGEYDCVVLFQHIRPLPCVAWVLVAAHADKGSTMEMKNHFLNFVLKVLLSCCFNIEVLLVILGSRTATTAWRTSPPGAFGLNSYFFRFKVELLAAEYSNLYTMAFIVLPLISKEVNVLAPNGSLDDWCHLITCWNFVMRILILGHLRRS